ncbi:MAG TPA: SDR family oxidoreductase, partial [Pyrinomonadaceae bacterium]|nr:SDR family oxidoreductase [Pyrinomonadaceae bacterium]
GIGRALVEHLISGEGNCVSVLGRNPSLDVKSPKLVQYAVDVSNREMLLSCLDQAVARCGKLACVVFLQRHRAGKDEFDMELAVALSATKNAIDHLVDRRGFSDDGQSNSIVLVSSIADRYVAPEQSLGYHLAKAGFSQLARYYALELGPLGIRVNSVSPCVVAKDEAREFYDKNEWLVDRYKKFIPLGRMGKPEDIVNAIMFLAGEQASYITGQNIVVDGGLTLRSHESLIRDLPREE